MNVVLANLLVSLFTYNLANTGNDRHGDHVFVIFGNAYPKTNEAKGNVKMDLQKVMQYITTR